MSDNFSTDSTDQKQDRFYSLIFLWTAIILSFVIAGWYYLNNPPAEGVEKKMKIFFAKNAKDVT